MTEPTFRSWDPQPTDFNRNLEAVGVDAAGRPVIRETITSRNGVWIFYLTAEMCLQYGAAFTQAGGKPALIVAPAGSVPGT